MISGLIPCRVVLAEDEAASVMSSPKTQTFIQVFLKGLKDYMVSMGRNIKFLGGLEYNGPIVKTRFLLSGGSDPESHTKEFVEEHPTGHLDVYPVVLPPNGAGIIVEKRRDGKRIGLEANISYQGKNYIKIVGDPTMYDRMFDRQGGGGRKGRPPKLYREYMSPEKWDLLRNPPPPKPPGRQAIGPADAPLSRYLRKEAEKKGWKDVTTYGEYNVRKQAEYEALLKKWDEERKNKKR